MRVLFADQFSEWGGAQLCLRDVMEEGARRGWEIHLMAPAGPLRELWKSRGVATRELTLGPYANGRKTFADALRFVPDMVRCGAEMRRVVKEHRIDLVVVNGPRILPAAVGLRCPRVFYAHSTPGKGYARTFARWSVRGRRTTVVAVSRFAGKWLNGKPVSVIYNGVKDLGFAVKPLGATVRIGIIGRIAPEKGHVDFIRAASEIAALDSRVRFVVVGTSLFSSAGYERRIREMAEDLPVEFPGWSGNVADTLHDLDILAVPSTSVEAATRVIMEAYSAGTPVVAYPSGGIPELVRAGETGLLTDGANAEALVRSIQMLLEDSELRAKLIHNGRAEWETRFRLDRFQREACDLLEQRAAMGGTPPVKSALQQAR